MNIVYTFNDKFVPQVAASICSICENNKAEKIVFYLLTDDLSVSNQKNLRGLISEYGQTTKIIEIGDVRDQFDFDFDTTGWNPVIVMRLLVDKFLPKGIDKVLYLDADTITRGSLAPLYNMELNDNIIGASIEPIVDKRHKQSLGIEHAYYNSGVLLIDMKKWRASDVGRKMVGYYRDHCGELFAPDQDVINVVLKGKIYTIAPKYNFCTYFMYYPYKFLKKLMSPDQYISEDIFVESVKDPVIVHYLGEARPWRAGCSHKYRKDYQKYLALTPWRETQDEQGWQVYFFCYDVFSMLTKYTPSVRYTFLNTFFPLVVKLRSMHRSKEESRHGGGV